MANITKFLPRKAQEKVARDAARLKLPQSKSSRAVVPPSRSSSAGGSSRSSSSSRTSPATSQVSVVKDKVFIDGVGYSVLPENQEAFILSQTGGRGASAQSALDFARKQAKVLSENARINKDVLAESSRIAALKRNILSRGGREIVRENLRDNKTGAPLKSQTIIDNRTGERVFILTNLATGEQTTKTYEKQRGFMQPVETGGLTSYVPVGGSQKEVNEIQRQLPIGDKLIYDKNTFEIKGIQSSRLGQTIPFTQRGVDYYNKELGKQQAKPIDIVQAIQQTSPKELIKQQVEDSKKNQQTRSQLEEANRWFRREITQASGNKARLKEQISKLKKEGKKQEVIRLTGELQRLNNSLIGYRTGLRITETLQGASKLPGVLINLVKDPRNVIPLSAAVWEGTKADLRETWQLAKVSPGQAIAKIGTDYFTGAFVGKAFKLTGKLTGKVARRLNPKWKSFSSGIIKINVPKEVFVRRGKEVFLRQRVGKIESAISRAFGGSKRVGQFKRFQKTPGIKLETGVIGSGVPLSEQLKLGGTRGTITTAQADRLVSFLRRQKMIRKPIPGEAKFTTLTKRLLQQFDDGKITRKNFRILNQRVVNESGGKTLLERSLYADPAGKVRFTRLGKDVAEANWRDLLTGNVSFKKTRPQIIVFPEGQIAKLPKSLKDIYNKLKQNKRLTPSERTKLVEWQVSNKGRSGKQWKVIGDTEYRGGVELEVTLAPGNEIRRVKKLAITEINGVPVQIVEAKVVRLKPSTTNLLNKAKRGVIQNKEVIRLRNSLRRELNLPVNTKDIRNLSRNIRRPVQNRPYFPVGRIITSRGLSRLSKLKVKRLGSPRTVRVKTTRPLRAKPVRTQRVKPVRTKPTRPTRAKPVRVKPKPIRPIRGRPARPRTPKPRPRPTPPIRLKLKPFKKDTLNKAQETYYVVERVRGKLKKLYPKPLTLKDARDYATYTLDNRLSRTAFFIPLGKSKKIVRPPRNIQNYYSKNRQKFRPYRIRLGKKKELVNGFIEKRKYALDTPGEKISSNRLRQQSPAQRKVMLNNLAKARAKLKRIRKKRR